MGSKQSSTNLRFFEAALDAVLPYQQYCYGRCTLLWKATLEAIAAHGCSARITAGDLLEWILEHHPSLCVGKSRKPQLRNIRDKLKNLVDKGYVARVGGSRKLPEYAVTAAGLRQVRADLERQRAWQAASAGAVPAPPPPPPPAQPRQPSECDSRACDCAGAAAHHCSAHGRDRGRADRGAAGAGERTEGSDDARE